MGGETVSSNQCLVFVKQRPAVVCTLHLAAFSQTYASSQDSAKKMCVFHIMEARQACLRPGKDLRTEKLVGITLRLGKYLDESVLLQTHFFLFSLYSLPVSFFPVSFPKVLTPLLNLPFSTIVLVLSGCWSIFHHTFHPW